MHLAAAKPTLPVMTWPESRNESSEGKKYILPRLLFFRLIPFHLSSPDDSSKLMHPGIRRSLIRLQSGSFALRPAANSIPPLDE